MSALLYVLSCVIKILPKGSYILNLLLGIYPNWFFIIARFGNCALPGAVGAHHPDLRLTAALGRVDDMRSVRGPAWIFVAAFGGGELGGLLGRDIHDEDVVIARLETFRPGKGDVNTVGTPGGVGGFSSSS